MDLLLLCSSYCCHNGYCCQRLVQSKMNVAEIVQLKSEKDKILKSLEQQVNENLKVKEVLKSINNNLLLFDENFKKLKAKFNELERLVPETICILSSIITQFMIIKDNSLEIR